MELQDLLHDQWHACQVFNLLYEGCLNLTSGFNFTNFISLGICSLQPIKDGSLHIECVEEWKLLSFPTHKANYSLLSL